MVTVAPRGKMATTGQIGVPVAPVGSSTPFNFGTQLTNAVKQAMPAQAASAASNAARLPTKPTANPGIFFDDATATRRNVTGAPSNYGIAQGVDQNGIGAAFAPRPPTVDPGNNFTNPGYTEQAFGQVQNRLLEDPSQAFLTNAANGTKTPTQGQQYMNQNLGTLDGPGQGDQYWNQVAGQFQNPMAGEQFARQATQNMSAQGPASAFYNNAMGQYDQFTGFQGGQNTQGQYGQSQQQLGNGSQGEQGLGQIAGQYGNLGQYNGQNNALGQYNQNAASGPLGAQQFYDQVGGSYNQMGQYSDPNLAAGQYGQTQASFGAMPTPDSADPYYDRAIQLGTQKYNSQAAGRGVYGSSDALSGVGNVITDLNAARAQNQFGNEMSIAQENRARQQLLGEQARMGDLSSLAGFGANLSGLETYGNLANQAGQQTLGQQTMLGAQARNADLSQSDAFNNNLAGASTFANINNQLGDQAIRRNELLGNLANQADSQALGAQNANIAGLNAFGNIASSADSAETNRYTASTNAMNQADRTGIDRMTAGANIANNVDANSRADYTASNNAAAQAAGLDNDRTRLGADLMNTASQNDLARINSFMQNAGAAEGSRQSRNTTAMNAISGYSKEVQGAITNALTDFVDKGQGDWENYAQAQLVPALQAQGLDQKQIDQIVELGAAYAKSKNGGS